MQTFSSMRRDATFLSTHQAPLWLHERGRIYISFGSYPRPFSLYLSFFFERLRVRVSYSARVRNIFRSNRIGRLARRFRFYLSAAFPIFRTRDLRCVPISRGYNFSLPSWNIGFTILAHRCPIVTNSTWRCNPRQSVGEIFFERRQKRICTWVSAVRLLRLCLISQERTQLRVELSYPSTGVSVHAALFSIVITQKNVTSLVAVCAIRIESTCIKRKKIRKSFLRPKFIIYKLFIIYKFCLRIKQAAMKRKICTILMKFIERNSTETAIWKITAFIKRGRARPKQSFERATGFVLRVLCGWSLSA